MQIVEFEGLCEGTVIKLENILIIGVGKKSNCSSKLEDEPSYA